MSFWVDLNDASDKNVSVFPFREGGTYDLLGSTEARLNVTYNYSSFYYKHLNPEKGLRWLDGKRASETIEALASAVTVLGTEQDEDYWEPTAGNAGYALSILLGWAKQYPDAIWTVN